MRKIRTLLFITITFLCYNELFSQITPEWVTTFNAYCPIYIYQYDMVTDKTGNVYIAGYTYDTIHHKNYVVTLKYNSSGQLQWNQHLDSLSYYPKIAIDDSGNVYIGCPGALDLITVKYNSQGIFKWFKSFKGNYGPNTVNDIITDDSCNVYITGQSNGNKFTTIKYNTLGNLQWIALDLDAGGSANSYIALDDNRNVYIVGRGLDSNHTYICNTFKYNCSGIKQWERFYQGNFNPGIAHPSDLKFDPNGYVYILAYTENGIGSDYDFAVVKYDTLGNQIWASSYSLSSHHDFSSAMSIDKYGNVYATGCKNSSGGFGDSIATVKFSSSGSFKWARTYSSGQPDFDYANAIAIDTLGYIYVSGKSPDNSNQENFVTIKYDSLGNQMWLARFENTLNSRDEANSIGLDDFGNIYVSGSSHEYDTTAILTVKYSFNVGLKEPPNNSENIAIAYPNPFETSFTIEIERNLINAELKIYDILGKEVINIKGVNNRKINILRNNLTDGLYFYSIIEKDKTIIKGKIIAE